MSALIKKSFLIVLIIAGGLIVVGVVVNYVYPLGFLKLSYSEEPQNLTAEVPKNIAPPPLRVSHLPTPEPLKAIYLTNWTAGIKATREKLVELIGRTELNAVVIDIKDYTGRIGFEVADPYLQKFGSAEKRIADVKEFIEELHARNIYVIGRVSSFQDAFLVKAHPEWAVKKESGGVWKDFKGISWLDVSARPVWDYLVAIAKESYNDGFDELQFDYIRFPSDGNMKDIAYEWTGTTTRATAVKKFFTYLSEHLKNPETFGGTTTPKISADLFGMTTTNKDDLGIGQVLENGLKYFDYVSPMVYPSHYPPNFDGYDNPNHYPYEIVKFSMDHAVARAIAASTTPLKLRPWLQDFNYGGIYDAAAVRKQIQATYDAGLTSWLLWSPGNRYTEAALFKE